MLVVGARRVGLEMEGINKQCPKIQYWVGTVSPPRTMVYFCLVSVKAVYASAIC
jgi:hypothetical protein